MSQFAIRALPHSRVMGQVDWSSVEREHLPAISDARRAAGSSIIPSAVGSSVELSDTFKQPGGRTIHSELNNRTLVCFS